jgi:hypothetical protein
MKIRLSSEQMEHAKQVAMDRRGNPHTVTRKFAEKRTDWEIDFLGAKAEVAFSLPLRGEICVEKKPQSSSNYDLGVDIVVEGIGMQVKATEHKNGRLIFKKAYEFNADVYVLSHVEEDLVHLKGWISKKKLFRCRNYCEKGTLRDTWIVENDNLSSIGSLLNKLEERKGKE